VSTGKLPPTNLSGPAAWRANDLAVKPDVWKSTLNALEVAELEHAAQRFLHSTSDIGSMSAAAFALPNLSHRLLKLKQKLLHGNGVELIRGLPIENYSLEFAACIFCGIGAHLGSARSQNAQGHILGHVRDIGARSADSNTRIYQTNERQTFHTDSADVVGLLCWNKAKVGGESLLVSAVSIYNELQARRPDLVPLLFEPIATDRRGEVPEGAKPYVMIPVFSWHHSYLTVFYQRQYIDSAQRFADAPRLTPAHVEALDLFDELANDASLHFRMQLEPGDMQFVYNHSQLHDRTGFEDWAEPQQRRHLLRLWLSLEGDRPLPECFKERYGSIEIGNWQRIPNAQLSTHTCPGIHASIGRYSIFLIGTIVPISIGEQSVPCECCAAF